MTNPRQFIDQFDQGQIEPFGHADHVQLAWSLLQVHPLPVAVQALSERIEIYARSKGQPTLFHATITWAYLFLIHERIEDSEGSESWIEFRVRHPDLFSWPNGALSRYYTRNLLRSQRARQTFVMPDCVGSFS